MLCLQEGLLGFVVLLLLMVDVSEREVDFVVSASVFLEASLEIGLGHFEVLKLNVFMPAECVWKAVFGVDLESSFEELDGSFMLGLEGVAVSDDDPCFRGELVALDASFRQMDKVDLVLQLP